MSPRSADPEVRNGLLRAARDLFLTRGFAATGIEEICAHAKVTKGALFHHFKGKDDLASAVLDEWTRAGFEVYSQASFWHAATAVERVLGYVDFTADLSSQAPIGCLIGSFAQEISKSHPRLREQCAMAFQNWHHGVAKMLDAAKLESAGVLRFDSESVAMHFVAIFEGAQVLAKANQSRTLVAEQLGHFRAYLAQLLGVKLNQGENRWSQKRSRLQKKKSSPK